MLEVTNVRLIPGQEEGFDHRFAAGEITVVLGANRSGKTDLCRLIAGLNTHARGQVSLAGADLSGQSPRQRPVGLVYQAFVNYPNLTVRQNIASPLQAQKLPAADIDATVAELAAKLRIEDLLQRLPHELSGGQQQRVAIARAMAKRAKVLLLDEPLVNLDFKLREALELELRDLLVATDTVVIYTSSDPRDAFALADQVLLLSQGMKLQSGPPLQVYQHPDSLAAMEVLADPGLNRFERDGALCAVRPEHVFVATGAVPEQGHLSFDMLVTAYETNGNESFVHGRVDDRDWVLRCRGMQTLPPGMQVSVAAAARDVLRF